MKFENTQESTPLFTVDKRGGLRIKIFEIEHDRDLSMINTYYGVYEGKLTKKSKIVKSNSRYNHKKRAEILCQGMINESRNEGYKLLNDVHKRYPEIKEKGIAVTPSTLVNLIGTEKTNADWLQLPMLAQRYDKIKKLNNIYAAQPKLNGVRCITRLSENEIYKMSRGGIKFNLPHLDNELRKIQNEVGNITLDGELYIHGIPLQVISGAARTMTESQNLFEDEYKNIRLEYHIYDIVNNQTQSNRLIDLDKLSKKFSQLKYIKFVETKILHGVTQINQYHDAKVSDGYEGIILREGNGKYEAGYRSNFLLKVKKYIDKEFLIIGCDYKQENVGESFVFILKNDTTDESFKARPTGSIEIKEMYAKNMYKILDKFATVRFQERSDSGLPIQGHVRGTSSEVLVEAVREQFN